MSREEIERELFRLGKTKMDVYRELSYWTDVTYNMVVAAIKSMDPVKRKTALVKRKIELQIMIWKHHRLENKMKNKKGGTA